MERFWSKVSRRGPDDCWDWLASKTDGGYGKIWFGGKIRKAHRVAWELTHGEIGEGLVVRHKCRGKCCNPSHMELGTQAENMQDMIRDGTSTRGERNPNTALTERVVKEIKDELRTKSVSQIARERNLGRMCVSHIKRGNSWWWV